MTFLFSWIELKSYLSTESIAFSLNLLILTLWPNFLYSEKDLIFVAPPPSQKKITMLKKLKRIMKDSSVMHPCSIRHARSCTLK